MKNLYYLFIFMYSSNSIFTIFSTKKCFDVHPKFNIRSTMKPLLSVHHFNKSKFRMKFLFIYCLNSNFSLSLIFLYKKQLILQNIKKNCSYSTQNRYISITE